MISECDKYGRRGQRHSDLGMGGLMKHLAGGKLRPLLKNERAFGQFTRP